MAVAAAGFLPPAAGAADVTVSTPETNRVGNGRNDNRSLEVTGSGSIIVGDGTAVSLGSGSANSRLSVTVDSGGVVQNTGNSGSGLYGTGPNTIEVGSYYDIVIDGAVYSNGNNSSGEAINVHGGSNTITVGAGGIVYSTESSAAIWFQDQVDTGQRNVVDNYGTIQRGGTPGTDPSGVHGNVIGTSAGNGIEFINRTGGRVYGSLLFANGNDSLTFYADSLVTGDIDGGGGVNDLTLNGTAGSYDNLAGAIKNFTYLTKDGDGTWNISGSLEGFTQVVVKQGVLGLTGNNDGYRGTLEIQSAGTVRARAQSLPTNNPNSGNTNNILNNGTLNLDQRLYDDTNTVVPGSEIDGAYYGQITGSGQVVKSGGGTVTLVAAAGNTYAGGTVIEDGGIGIIADSSLGAADGSLTMGMDTADGGTNGTLRFDADNITLSDQRDITLRDGGGTFDTQSYTATVTQNIDGTGALTKTGTGVLILGDASTVSTYDGVNINQGTLAIRTDGALGDADGDLNFGTDAADGNYNGTLRLDESVTLSTGRTITLRDGGGTINTNGANVIGTINQDIGGTGSLTKTGAGILDLTSNGDNNTYTGGTNIQEGTVRINSVNDLGAGGGLSFGGTSTAGTLQLTDDVDLTPAGPVQLNAGGGIIDTNGNDGILSQDIAGSGSLTKTGDGDLNMEANGSSRTYTGGTNISQGSVTIGAGTDLGADGTRVTMGTNGAGATAGTLRVTDDVDLTSRPIVLNDGGGIIDTDIYTVTASGNISGTGKLTKDGTGILELYGNSTYSGGTDVREGTLAIDSGAALGAASGPLHMYDGTTLRFDNTLSMTSRPVEIGSGGPGGIVIIDTNGHDGLVGGNISGSARLQKDGEGILALYGTNTYQGGTHVTEGTLAIDSGAALGAAGTDLEMDAGTTLRFDRNVTIADRDIILNGTAADRVTIDTQGWNGFIESGADITGGAGLVKEGLGFLVINANTSYTGPTDINRGILEVNGSIGTAGQDVTVAPGAVLGGIGTVTGRVFNTGVVAPGRGSAGNPIGTLTIDGDYEAGDGAQLYIASILGGDDSPTSVLHITGDILGAPLPTAVHVQNLYGTGAETNRGIEIIVVDGASPNSAFRLAPDHIDDNGAASVVGGAYLYYMKQGDAYDTPSSMNNWYLMNVLRNDRPVYQPNVPLFEAYPQVLAQFNRMPTLVQRVGFHSWQEDTDPLASGEAYGSPAFEYAVRQKPAPSVWMRTEGSTGKYHPTLSSGSADFRMDYGMAHLGLDWPLLSGSCGSQLVAGASVHYGYGKAKVNSSVGLGKIRTRSPGFGGTLTWYQRNGFYVDARARVNYFKSDIDSHSLLIQSQVRDNKGLGQAYSLETGKVFGLGASGRWSLTPQGQLTYSRVDYDFMKDRYGTPVSLEKYHSLESRLGLALSFENSCRTPGGSVRRIKSYLQADWYHEFAGRAEMQIGLVDFRSHAERNLVGLTAGSTYTWKNDTYAVYGELSARSSTSNFGKGHVFGGEVGFRFSF